MSAEDQNPPGQKTVFRPSPLGVRAAGDAGPSGVLPQRTTIGALPPLQPQSQPHPFVAPQRHAMAQDDVPPLGVPMRVRNPIMAAAARMLALAAAILAERQVTDPAGLMLRASAEAKAFEKTLTLLGLSTEDNARARYAVLATVDDIVQNLPGGMNSDWARQSLVVQSFGQSFGGDQFWTILDDMLARPAAYRDLLELYHACLAAGFQGRFRVSPDGPQQLGARMTAIHAALSDIRARPENDLVPSWQGRPTPARKAGWLSKALLAGGALLVLLVVVFVGLKLLLDSRDDEAYRTLHQVIPPPSATIGRAVADVPAPVSTQFERIRSRITQPCIDSFDDGATIRLVITACPAIGGPLFDKGAAEIAPAYEPVISNAGRALADEPGRIAVIAHTDADPIRGMLRANYPDNKALSDARAANARALLEAVIGDPSRLTAAGRGDREPIDRSDTAEAKARNRRVELIIPRSE